jgi:hypothetical protein
MRLAVKTIINTKVPKWLAERSYNIAVRNLTYCHNGTIKQDKWQGFGLENTPKILNVYKLQDVFCN